MLEESRWSMEKWKELKRLSLGRAAETEASKHTSAEEMSRRKYSRNKRPRAEVGGSGAEPRSQDDSMAADERKRKLESQ